MKKILIVNANYYKEISNNLVLNAKKKLLNVRFHVSTLDIPGALEIPISIRKNINKFDGFVALGCVIKGETPHFDFISTATTDAIMKISVKNKKPIGNGILTCLNKKQAEIRSKQKGKEAAKAVISVLGVLPSKVYPR